MLYLTLRHYEYIVAVANTGSMSAAAQSLNVSQPALSVAVQTVENHLGKTLFIRRKGVPIRATGFAHSFVQKAEALIAIASELEDAQKASAMKRETLRLGCFVDLAPGWLAPTVKVLRSAMPDLKVELVVADFERLAAEIASGGLDLAITYDLGLDATYERRRLARVRPFAFMGKEDVLAGRESVTLAELADRPLILFEEGLSIRHMLGLFAAQNLRPRIAHRVASLEVMRSFAANGEGVGISYSAPGGSKSYDGAEVVRLPISDPAVEEDIVAAFRADMAEIAPIEAVTSLFKRNL